MKKMNFSVTILMEKSELRKLLIELNDMPNIPRKGDFIEILSFIDREKITEKQFNIIDSFFWEVYSINWVKINDSYNVIIRCEPRPFA